MHGLILVISSSVPMPQDLAPPQVNKRAFHDFPTSQPLHLLYQSECEPLNQPLVQPLVPSEDMFPNFQLLQVNLNMLACTTWCTNKTPNS